LILLAFVIPVTIYCFTLALANRGRRPVMVPGIWDCAGVLFAVSGFLIAGGPAVLTALYEQWRMSWLFGQTRFLQELGRSWHFWLSLWVAYWVLVVAGAGLLIYSRRKYTSIYNVEPAVFDERLAEVLDQQGLETMRAVRGRLLIYRRNGGESSLLESRAVLQHALGAGPEIAFGAGSKDRGETLAANCTWAELGVEPFEAMRHVTLRWIGGQRSLRHLIEGELARSLAEVQSVANPAGKWLMSLASCLGFLSFAGISALVLLRILNLPR
jgi:hypothetical protein